MDAMSRAPRHPRTRRAIAGLMAALLTGAAGFVLVAETRIIGDTIDTAQRAAFYEQPAGAADGAPGSVVKSEELFGTPIEARAWRIMYRSTDLFGEPVVVTGVLIEPLGPAPEGGRTIVSWGHLTTGTALECAPSYSFDSTIAIEGLRMLLDRGYAVVATDYTGMGTAGPDSYLIGKTAGQNVLDAARAARELLGDHVSSDVILWGHSQGGQAVLFAAELAADYAPELTVQAVAAAAPAADLSTLMQAHQDDISGVTIGSYAFAAFADTYGASVAGADLASILSPEAVQKLPEMNALCLLDSVGELHTMGGPLVGNFTTADASTTEPWATLLTENSAGSVAFDAPLFLAQGLDDKLILPADTKAFAEHEDTLGIRVTYEQIPGATHGTVAYLALPGLAQWLDGVAP